MVHSSCFHSVSLRQYALKSINCSKGTARWALLSEQVAPGAPCALSGRGKCPLVSNPDTYTNSTVNWLGCSGTFKRWFHSPCLKFSQQEFENASKRKKWFCNLSDCKLWWWNIVVHYHGIFPTSSLTSWIVIICDSWLVCKIWALAWLELC